MWYYTSIKKPDEDWHLVGLATQKEHAFERMDYFKTNGCNIKVDEYSNYLDYYEPGVAPDKTTVI